jgi:MFS transporter, SP family, galactose:H+ symporter
MHTPELSLFQRFPVALIASITALSGLIFGLDIGIISGAQNLIFETFGIDSSYQTATLRGFLVACVPLGAFIGAMCSGVCANYFGRRKSIMLTALFYMIGAACIVWADSTLIIIIGRCVLGVGIGIAAMVAPMYLSEISPPKVRGAAVLSFQLAITLGIVTGFGLNVATAHFMTDPNTAWRFLFSMLLPISFILLVGIYRLPCSPRWLLMIKQDSLARQSLEFVYKKTSVDAEMNAIHSSLEHASCSGRELFQSPILKLVVLSFLLFAFQQLSGINAIMYYGPAMFEQAGFGSEAKLLAQAAMGLLNFAMTLVSLWLIDRVGRRVILCVGLIGMASCLAFLGYTLHFPFAESHLWAFAATLGYIAFFSPSLGGVPYVTMSEVFPLKARAGGMAIASCANWGFNVVVTQSFTLLESNLGMGNAFWLYAICTFFGFMFAYKYLPETRGKSLEHIEANLYAGKSLRNLGH